MGAGRGWGSRGLWRVWGGRRLLLDIISPPNTEGGAVWGSAAHCDHIQATGAVAAAAAGSPDDWTSLLYPVCFCLWLESRSPLVISSAPLRVLPLARAWSMFPSCTQRTSALLQAAATTEATSTSHTVGPLGRCRPEWQAHPLRRRQNGWLGSLNRGGRALPGPAGKRQPPQAGKAISPSAPCPLGPTQDHMPPHISAGPVQPWHWWGCGFLHSG